MKSYEIGVLGEKIASKFIAEKNYIILDKNYKITNGEIDIIAKRKDIIVFIEVKARSNLKYGIPAEYLTRKKRDRITKTAKFYILSHNLNNYIFRFDLVEIYFDKKYNLQKIIHLENVF